MTTSAQSPRTMFAKIWDEHVVHHEEGKQTIIYIDRHLVHEVTSPQAFESLRSAGRQVRRPDLTLAVADHNVPTTRGRTDDGLPLLVIEDAASATQLSTLEANVSEFGVRYIDVLAP